MHANELRVRVTGTRKEGDLEDGGILEGGDITGADFLFRCEPAQLVAIQLHTPISMRFMRFFIERVEMEVQFGYVLEAPLPIKARARLRSRGIGRFRIDQETVAVIDYEGAHNAGPDR